jgi:imidazolonepropionase-like amidohydrolase
VTASTTAVPRGVVLRGQVWPGGAASGWPDAIVVLDADGVIGAMGPARDVAVPDDLPVIGHPGCWLGPGIADAHVHLAFGPPAMVRASGVIAVRDLGAPPPLASGWRTAPGTVPPARWPYIAVAGQMLTAPGGYPMQTWGADGFGLPVAGASEAVAAVDALVDIGIDVVKVALEPSGGAPVPDAATLRAAVDRAHRHGLAVTAHALSVRMVERALAAGVDELCHTPTERLPDDLVERLASRDIPVVSTLATLSAGGKHRSPLDNAARLVAAGVSLVYGTDLGNTGTRPGADPVELALLADAGLGARGALIAATGGSAGVSGLAGRTVSRVRVGQRMTGVVLPADPLMDPTCWRRPLAVLTGLDPVASVVPPPVGSS